MQNTVVNKGSDVTYDLFKRVGNGDFEYVYRGCFSQAVTRRILSLVERNIRRFINSVSLQNRIYFLMVETMQNISRHQDNFTHKSNLNDEHLSVFSIEKRLNCYILTTGNTILNTKIEPLREKINRVNSISKDELKELHRSVLSNGKISSKGGAGLGLIEMVRRSGNKLLYNFEKIDEELSYFYLQTRVNANLVSEQPSLKKKNDCLRVENSIKYAQKLNKLLNAKNVFLNFNGFLNKKNIISLLSVIRGHMQDSSISKKLYYVMLEMLQNVSKHGCNIANCKEGVPGIFYIQQTKDGYILTSGNYIGNAKLEILQHHLTMVNNYSVHELNKYFDRILLYQKQPDAGKTGLGFIDIRLKTNAQINCDVKRINDEASFLKLQTFLKIAK